MKAKVGWKCKYDQAYLSVNAKREGQIEGSSSSGLEVPDTGLY